MATKAIAKPYERINVTLPRHTLALIDRVVEKGDRSKVIDTAVLEYIRKTSKDNLRKGLKEGALRNAAHDLALADEWFSVDEETWRKNKN
jgi:metal-responsive CopG/Arc/MetJ family transcriptional regulator